jgi:DNA helicase HerA-like ATPase
MFEQLPEVGDPDQPKLVFFFDEAHLLFDEAPKVLLQKIEQVVRLIRSKGVGVYFVTQNPIDVPETVLAQLGNRVQHALRAYTPAEQKGVKAAAQAFRPNPKLNTERVITELGKGEALVSFLEGNGVPAMVQQTLIRPPSARVGPVTPAERRSIISASPVRGKYDEAVDRESAYEMLQKKAAEAAPPEDSKAESGSSGGGLIGSVLGGLFGGGKSRRMSTGEVVVKQVARSVASQVGTQVGRAIVRGILGGLKR